MRQDWVRKRDIGAIWTTLERWMGDVRIWYHRRELDECDSILMVWSEYSAIIRQYRAEWSDIRTIRVIVALY